MHQAGPGSELHPAPARSFIAIALFALSCTGVISAPSPADEGSRSSSGSQSGVGFGPDGELVSAPGVSRLRRLTLLEYRNTLRDLLGLSQVDTAQLAGDQQASTSGYTVGAAITSAPDARAFLERADELSLEAMPELARQVPCIEEADAGESCAEEFITKFGRRAFRRPLVAEEIAALVALHVAQRDPAVGASFAEAIRGVTMAILQSPAFLYRRELAPGAAIQDGDFVRFNSYEVASRLSYALWASMPDDALFQLAEADELRTPESVAREARRMLIDPKAKDVYGDFTAQWLDLTPVVFAQKVPELNFTPEVGAMMLAETGEFIADIFMGADTTGRLDLMFTSTRSFVNETLARLYGLTGVEGEALRPVELDPTQRAGLLTQLSFLTMHGESSGSFPVRRGAYIIRRVMCQDVPPPPDVVVGEMEELEAGLTTRQRFEQHSSQPCASCHAAFDPLGFAFENYDGVGQYRTTDNGQPVDASGTVQLSSGLVDFRSALDLMPSLATADEVRACVATQWMRYLLRRRETDGDLLSLEAVQEAFRDSGYDLRELLVAIVSSDAFLRRTPAEGEVLP